MDAITELEAAAPLPCWVPAGWYPDPLGGLAVAGLAPAAAEPPALTQETSTVSTADELAKLAQLFESGVLTENEFKAAKARLLGP
jgi:hypothetical protein